MASEDITRCDDYAARKGADTDAWLRKAGFVLSSFLLIALTAAHIFFEWHAKHLPVPDIVWAATYAPWVGASIGKMLRMIKGGK